MAKSAYDTYKDLYEKSQLGGVKSTVMNKARQNYLDSIGKSDVDAGSHAGSIAARNALSGSGHNTALPSASAVKKHRPNDSRFKQATSNPSAYEERRTEGQQKTEEYKRRLAQEGDNLTADRELEIARRVESGLPYQSSNQPAQMPQFGNGNTGYGNSSESSASWLDSILQDNSKLMQRSASQGQQVANSRGLLNSSMASEAAQGAMIDRATPLAQQDAQYWQNRGINEQQYGFQRGLNEQQYGFDMGRMQQEYGFNSELSTQEFNQALGKLKATSTANGWGVMANNLTDIIGQYSGQLERIQMNPDIDDDSKSSLIEQVLSMRDADLDFQRSMYDQLPNYLANTGVFPNR